MKTIERYGTLWNKGALDLEIELGCIRRGGQWINAKQIQCGNGLFFHYKRAQQLVWPEDDDHRWSDLILKEILANTITCINGPKDSCKTRGMAKYGLIDYFCFPNNTLIIVSSTTLHSLEGRVWGDIKSLWRRAKERFPWDRDGKPIIPGVVLDNKHAISTDNLDDDAVLVRDMRRGIICVPCKLSGGSENNISTYVGMKQERRRYLADEFQFMSNAMFNSLANMNAGNFKMVAAGNPIGQDDPLDKISEPENGWDSVGIPEKTTVWKNRLFLDSKTVCLIGTDSPNFDYPEDQPTKYWYMVNRDSIARVVAGYGKDSSQYWSQCVGMRRAGMMSKRVITAQICRQHRAFEDVIWEGSKTTTKIAGLDAAYGGVGGDRCVLIVGEFGLDNEGKTILLVHAPIIVPVSVKLDKKPEDQIARWCMDYCVGLSIPPANFFYDSTGRGLLHAAFTRVWSSEVEGVEFGGAPSNRIVSADLFVTDMKTLRNRPLLCNEHYMNFVTELWFSVRYAIESEQIRGLPNDVAEEGYARMYYEVKAKIQVEPKPEMKERTGWSPDKFDSTATLVEGARRRGFIISRLGATAAAKNSQDWLRKWQEEHRATIKRHELNYHAA